MNNILIFESILKFFVEQNLIKILFINILIKLLILLLNLSNINSYISFICNKNSEISSNAVHFIRIILIYKLKIRLMSLSMNE